MYKIALFLQRDAWLAMQTAVLARPFLSVVRHVPVFCAQVFRIFAGDPPQRGR